jgi:pimeloyl-ACP methyl ester carboxylesterase
VTSDFTEHRFTSGDGLSLSARIYGSGHALPAIVCLAGLTRNARDFHGLSGHLSGSGFRVIAFDSRGRGQSERARNASEYNILTEAEDVLAGLTALGIAHAGFIGTSRGGLILHLLNSMRPSALKAAVLNDVGPEIEPDGLLLIRRYLQTTPRPSSWEDAADLQMGIHGKAFPALSRDDWMRHARAVYREDEGGRIVADFDPRIADTLNAITPDAPLPALWPQFAGFGGIPLMVIRGEHSRLLSQETFRQMGERHPGAELVTVSGQGHAPHLDTGDLPQRIAAFFTRAFRERVATTP